MTFFDERGLLEDHACDDIDDDDDHGGADNQALLDDVVDEPFITILLVVWLSAW